VILARRDTHTDKAFVTNLSRECTERAATHTGDAANMSMRKSALRSDGSAQGDLAFSCED